MDVMNGGVNAAQDELQRASDSSMTSGATAPPPAAGPTQPAAGAPAAAPATGAAATTAAPATPPMLGNDGSAPERRPAGRDDGNFGGKVMHSILDALGGTSSLQYERDPQTGKMIVTAAKTGPGQQWKRIIAGAATGAAASAGIRPGPNAAARGVAAGFGAGEQLTEKIDQRKQDTANQDFEAQQRTTLMKAQLAKLNQDVSTSAFELGRRKVTAQFQDAERETALSKSIEAGGLGSVDLGVAKTFDDVLKMHKDLPNLVEQQAHGNVIGIPHVNDSGQIEGMHYALVTPEWKAAKLEQDETYFRMTPPAKPGDKPRVEKETVKAGTMTNQDFWTARMAGEQEIMKWYTEQSKESAATDRAKIGAQATTQAASTHAAATVKAAEIGASSREKVAENKPDAEAKAIQKQAGEAASKVRPMVNLLDSAEDYYKGAKFDSAGDLGLIVNAVRAMNPGTVRLPNKELEMEIKRGTYGDQAQRWYTTKIESGTLPNQFRDELMGVIRRETQVAARGAAKDWVKAYGGTDKIPDHLQRFAEPQVDQATHVFSLGAWQKANPQGNADAAKQAAIAAGYKVTQ